MNGPDLDHIYVRALQAVSGDRDVGKAITILREAGDAAQHLAGRLIRRAETESRRPEGRARGLKESFAAAFGSSFEAAPGN